MAPRPAPTWSSGLGRQSRSFPPSLFELRRASPSFSFVPVVCYMIPGLMNDRNAVKIDPIRKYLPVMLLLFVGSGCAALIYEVVWFQLLQLVIGSSSVSLGVLLGTFMGGMCLGSYLLPRYVGSEHHPLKIYAFLELGIGLMGLVLLFGMPLVNGIYV